MSEKISLKKEETNTPQTIAPQTESPETERRTQEFLKEYNELAKKYNRQVVFVRVPRIAKLDDKQE